MWWPREEVAGRNRSSIETTGDDIAYRVGNPLDEPCQAHQNGIDRRPSADQAAVEDALDPRDDGVVVRIFDLAIEGDREIDAVGARDSRSTRAREAPVAPTDFALADVPDRMRAEEPGDRSGGHDQAARTGVVFQREGAAMGIRSGRAYGHLDMRRTDAQAS